MSLDRFDSWFSMYSDELSRLGYDGPIDHVYIEYYFWEQNLNAQDAASEMYEWLTSTENKPHPSTEV